jgi:hypothetical protein
MLLPLLECHYDNAITITGLLLWQCHYNYWAVTTTMPLQLLDCYYGNDLKITGMLLCHLVEPRRFYVKYSGSYITSNVHHVETHCHYVRLHVKGLSLLPDFSQTSIVSTNLSETHKTNFHENPSIGNGVASCGRTDRQRNMPSLTAGFRSCA